MRGEWQLQEAKGNFSQLIKRAASGDVQIVTVQFSGQYPAELCFWR